jgi:hypothetical protein
MLMQEGKVILNYYQESSPISFITGKIFELILIKNEKKNSAQFIFYVDNRGFSSIPGARYCAILAEIEWAGNIPVPLTGSAGTLAPFPQIDIPL